MKGKEPQPPTTAEAGSKKNAEHAHLITVENLIVHKYSDQDILLAKADKVARQIINEDLREGEYLQTVQPGRYYLHCPRMKPDAGALRCAVLTEKIFRAVRDLNPAAQRLNMQEDPEAATPAPKDKGPAPAVRTEPRPAARPPTPPDAKRDAEMKKLSAAAMAAMTGPGALSREELLNTPLGMRLSTDLTIEQSPMWYASQRIIIGHDCVPMLDGASLRNVGLQFRDVTADPNEVRAAVDTVTYERVAEMLRKNLAAPTRGLVICPVHASTLAHTRYVGAFIASGSGLPPEAQNYLIFLVKGFALPVSRIKVRDAAAYLKPRARGMLVDLPLNTDDINPCFKEFGFHGARTTVTDFAGQEAAALKHLNGFAERCDKARLRSTIDGLESQSLTVAALAAGFSYLSGTAIQRRAGESGELQDFDVDALFK